MTLALTQYTQTGLTGPLLLDCWAPSTVFFPAMLLFSVFTSSSSDIVKIHSHKLSGVLLLSWLWAFTHLSFVFELWGLMTVVKLDSVQISIKKWNMDVKLFWRTG